MVKLNKIYTKTGDDGSTGLVDGSRRQKSNLRVEAYGTIDEANAALGLVRFHTADNKKFDDIFSRIQNDLFDLGADLANPENGEKSSSALRINSAQVARLEDEIDKMNSELSPLRSFVLPGGSKAAAFLHLARTIVRRAERVTVALMHEEVVNPSALHYINRLSDLLFVAARFANQKGEADVLWVPGKNR